MKKAQKQPVNFLSRLSAMAELFIPLVRLWLLISPLIKPFL